ncbi:cell wall-binding repeat-containing protein [Herbiconiux sp. UC225_62]|uniref:cell wall-binding repeat-containing protein n=1 Tax=Herbiconiux sp. UC225_62 TaxID=3350168 RepID=UPI0036D2A712
MTITQLADYVSTDDVREVAVDWSTRRAFLLEGHGGTSDVRIFDISGSALTSLATIAGFTAPSAIAVNEKTHQLFVVDAGATNRVMLVDANPASPTANTLVGSIGTAGTGDARISVDSDANIAYVAHATSESVSVVDIATGTVKESALIARPVDIAVDSINHRAFVGVLDRAISVVSASGVSTVPIAHLPQRLGLAGGRLVVLDEGDDGKACLESFNPDTLAAQGGCTPVIGLPIGFQVDEARHLIYLLSGGAGVPGVQIFSSGSLKRVLNGPSAMYVAGAIDPSSHDLLVLDVAKSAGRLVRLWVTPDPPAEVHRIGGSDRFDVAAGVSAEAFAPGVPVVYVASGSGFADALSGSAAAGVGGGPILLVTRDGIPTKVAAELTRLRPARIVVLGGTTSVSAAVESQLARYGRAVSRDGGADRFEVSASVSADAFGGGARVAFVASGEVFPDALSGSAAAGQLQGPVLLVQKRAVPAAVEAELVRLHPDRIVVIGGEATIDASVAAALGGIAPVSRIAGSDRFAVSANVSAAHVLSGVDTVYVASGAVFSDALSGSAAAIADRSPVLLVDTDSIPAVIDAELKRLAPYRIVVLGGPDSVSDQVAQRLDSYLPG